MVGRLNGRAVFDPRFADGFGSAANAAQTSEIYVRRQTGKVGAFDYEAGKRSEGGFTNLWRCNARVQPNKDWRARGYVFGDETTVFQAVRFQFSLVDGRRWDEAANDWAEKPTGEPLPALLDEDQIIILRNFFPGLDAIKDYVYTIRNSVTSSNAALMNVLTDVDLKGGVSVGNP